MAMSAMAAFKVRLAAQRGQKIPEGVAIDRDGNITTDPSKMYALLPFGGYKGFGLAVAIDILCGILIGGGYSLKIKRSWFSQGGVITIAIKIDIFRSYNDYLDEITEYVSKIKSVPRIENYEILMPGEPEYRIYKERLRDGIPLDDEIYKELMNLAEKFNVDPPMILRKS